MGRSIGKVGQSLSLRSYRPVRPFPNAGDGESVCVIAEMLGLLGVQMAVSVVKQDIDLVYENECARVGCSVYDVADKT